MLSYPADRKTHVIFRRFVAGRNVLLFLFLVILAAVGPRPCCLAESLRSDSAAAQWIIGNESLLNTLAFYQRLDELPAGDQFVRLRDNVFPPESDWIRIEAVAAPRTWPASRAAQLAIRFPTLASQDDPTVLSAFRPPVLLAPAVSLVDVAAQLDRLSEIETLLENRAKNPVNSDTDALILKSLLAIARRQPDQATEQMFALSDVLEKKQQVQHSIGGILALVWKTSPNATLREPSMALAMRCYELARIGGSPLNELWKRHSFATHYRLQAAAGEVGVTDTASSSTTAGRWHAVSRSTVAMSGQGYPAALWRLTQGQASKMSPSDRDFLMFDIPLTGDFAVEAIVSAFNYHETQLGYGGTWTGPTYDHKTLMRGHFARDHSTLNLSPPLDEITDSMRVRLEVRDDTVTTLINGRRVNQTAVSVSDPWLTIFSDWYTHGWVRNLRILGEPLIPDSIDLLADERLLGWDAYYGSVEGDDADWQSMETADYEEPKQKSEKNSTFVLRGKQRDLIAGSYCERLLRYHRPILEDATFSYEFYYRTGSHGVHPAIGNQAFVLNPDGQIATHDLTDGVEERLGKHPQPPLGTGLSLDGSPLRSGQWNQMEIAIRGDRIRFTLNSEPIYETLLTDVFPRVFGLFHYCDQTEALVRNLRWSGGWRKELEAVRKQRLTDPTLEQILAGSEMKHTFRHSFADGLPLDIFAIMGEGWKENLTQLPSGIRLVRPGGNYVHYTITPDLQIDGDFDVIADFEDFGASTASGGDGNIKLMLGFSENNTDYRMYRKFSRFAKKELGQQMIQAGYFYSRDGQRVYEFPKLTSEASSGGRLRFIRRGDQLHFLFAANDSTYFRLFHIEPAPKGPTRIGGIGLGIEATRAGETKVTWKSLEVHAEHVSGKAMVKSRSLEQLNQSRDQLP
ncbi:DUF1583 domain-containing protein [Neorhodopirellula pilleata]|nr:DUF1583 domain-containing protein [Neorhodopirellula pilleata]